MWIVRGGGGRSSFAPARRPSRRPRPDKWEGLGSNNTFSCQRALVLGSARGACQRQIWDIFRRSHVRPAGHSIQARERRGHVR